MDDRREVTDTEPLTGDTATDLGASTDPDLDEEQLSDIYQYQPEVGNPLLPLSTSDNRGSTSSLPWTMDLKRRTRSHRLETQRLMWGDQPTQTRTKSN